MSNSRLLMHIDVGPVPTCFRRMVALCGGSFNGPRLRGDVLPIDADWNLVRSDGVMLLSALYLLKTHDGVHSTFHTGGMIHGIGGQMEQMTTGHGTNGSTLHTRLKTHLEAPEGRYDWINNSLWVGQLFPPESSERASMAIYENA